MPDRTDHLASLFVAGARAAAARDAWGVDAAIDELAVRVAGDADPAGVLGPSAARAAAAALERLWESGWQPAEVVRAVRRSSGPRHAAVVTEAVVADPAATAAGAPPPWRAQLVDLAAACAHGASAPPSRPTSGGAPHGWFALLVAGAGSWVEVTGTVIEALGVLVGLPALAPLLPPPSAWGRGAWVAPEGSGDPLLEKVRALLAKAESTAFAPEAAALTAKAQELIRRHALDGVDPPGAGGAGDGRGRPSPRRLAVDDPYADAKSNLLAAIGAANDVRCVWHADLATMTLVGFPADVEGVEALFTSLLVQASRQMLAERPSADRGRGGALRAYRHAFLLAFAGRIGERLAEAAAAGTRAVEAERSESMLPVLADRRALVDAAVDDLFPRLRTGRRRRVSDAEGWLAGRAAADEASLGPAPPLLRRAHR
ncbi:MAG TPA: DUF2786 domain-containing protein [Acidimicrobiales bacterium]|nr:DUF2786 domain-containing protein [Acidimicrobiales bacterium]